MMANSITQHICLILAAIFACASLISVAYKKYPVAVALLTAAGFCIYSYAALVCNFLNVWDEQYHALVAKNMLNHPFVPQLYTDEIVSTHGYLIWADSHIWLHKQPLFLWEIALSFKIFGVSEYALRLPSVLHCALLIPVCYRMGLLLTKRHLTGFLTAFCAAGSCFLLRLTSGMLNTDHNDVCFVFYVTCSLWVLLEYLHTDRKQWRWIVLIGLFSGAAILTKWLVGLLVYLAWGLYLIAEYGLKIRQWHLGHLLTALFITVLLAAPWQIYCLHQFPIVAQQEMLLNSQHFTNVIEGHGESPLYFLQVLPFQYFGHGYKWFDNRFHWNFYTISSYLMLFTGLFLLIRSLKNRSWRITLVGMMLFVYLFFSIAATKMVGFTFVLCSVWFLSIATLLQWMADKLYELAKHKKVCMFVLVFVGLLFGYYQTNMGNFNNECPQYVKEGYLHNKRIYQSWVCATPKDCYIFNVNSSDSSHYSPTIHIAGMFYSERQCYTELPSLELLHRLQQQGCKVAVAVNAITPAEYLQDSTLILLTDSLSFY